MPANLSPEYKAAEAAFKQAHEPRERLECLREMLRTIPKHKGTEHLQADLKTRIKQLTEDLANAKKAGARRGPPQVIRAEGAAQVALLGAPNVGKSALHAHLTGSHAEVGPYPFTTQHPLPGMLPFEGVNFQLIDLPPLSPEHPVPWIANALQPANAALLIVDLTDPDCVEHVIKLRDILISRKVTLWENWGSTDASDPEDNEDEEMSDPFAIFLPTLLVATKADEVPSMKDELDVFEELLGVRYPALAVSVTTGEGMERIGPFLFENLGIVRVYTKAPGKPADTDQPFTLRRGGTVLDVALLVHRDFESTLKYARLWGGGHFKGQQVGREHVVADGDILELHD